MLKETAAAAVAKLGTDFPDVTSRDLGAAQGAMGVRARAAVIDKNEAEHVGPPPGDTFTLRATYDGPLPASAQTHFVQRSCPRKELRSKSKYAATAPEPRHDGPTTRFDARICP